MKIYQDEQKLKELYEKERSGNRIAEFLGVNPKTIYVWMKKFGIDTSQTGSQGARKNYLNSEYFEKIETEEKAYWLGFIMADGCVYRGSNETLRLQINLKASDVSHLEKFQKAIQSNYKIQIKNVGSSSVALLKVNSTKMCEDLQNHGVIFRKSMICEMPPDLPKHLRRHFFRGYFDGDGCLSFPKNKNPRFCIVGGRPILLSFQKELAEEGISMKLYSPWKGKKVHSLESSKKETVQKSMDYLYKDSHIFLERKKNKYLQLLSMSNMSPLGENPSTKLGEFMENPNE